MAPSPSPFSKPNPNPKPKPEPEPNPNPNPRLQPIKTTFKRLFRSGKKPPNSQAPRQTAQQIAQQIAQQAAQQTPQQTPQQGQALQVPSTSNLLPLDIFPKDGVVKEEIDVTLPKIGDPIRETLQLFSCATLLSGANASAISLSCNTKQREWTAAVDQCHPEKLYIHQLARQVARQFRIYSDKDPAAIREVVILGRVLDKHHYRQLLNCFLGEFISNTLINTYLLQGLVQLVLDAPDYFLRGEDLIKVLRTIRLRLNDSSKMDKLYSTHLSVAVCKILIFMAECKVEELDRKEEHEPLLQILNKLRRDEDPFVKFYGEYAFQALLCIPDDESILMELGRHACMLAGGALKMSGVYKVDLDGVGEGSPAVLKGFLGLMNTIRGLIGFGDQIPWYKSIQISAEMIKTGQLLELNKWIDEAPFHREAMFQWTISQLLGEIALDPTWDADTRKQAVNFLGELYKVNAGSTAKRLGIRRWILTILDHISADLGPRSALAPLLEVHHKSIQDQASALALDLKKDGTISIEYPYPLSRRLPLPNQSLLLKKVDNMPEEELALHRLKLQRMSDFDAKSIYIPPFSKPNLHATGGTPTLLHDRAKAFLRQDSKSEVLLILGDSGAGKSTFSLNLEHKLWDAYEPGDPIPLHIDLKTIEKPDRDLVDQHVKSLHLLTPNQIEELKLSRTLVLICDGYDECRKWSNLFENNRFNKDRGWKCKMIICCRSQSLGANYQYYFDPKVADNQNFSHLSDLLEEAVIVPFEESQIKEYVEKYITTQEARELFKPDPVWTTDMYMERLSKIIHLMDLARNPFLLRIVLDTLPRIAPSTTRITRVDLYDEFVELNFETEVRKLILQHSNDKMDRECVSKFTEIEGDEFIYLGLDFSKRLSASIFKEQDGVNSVEYSVMEEGSWKAQYFSFKDYRTKLLRESAQLVRRKNLEKTQQLFRYKFRAEHKTNSYEFTHRSILEYFFSCVIFEPREGITEQKLAACLASADSSSALADHPFGQRSLVAEPSIIHFLAERVNQFPEFRKQLLDIVELSKANPKVGLAAANAITILTRAGVNFNGADLRGIQIAGADLTGGHFDSAQLQDADLQRVNFTRSWLRKADFSRAQMSEISLGQQPLFGIVGVRACAGSSDGTMLALGFYNGEIKVYNPATWAVLYTFQEHKQEVLCLAFSHDDRILASGSADNTVWIRGLATEICYVMDEHTEKVNCIAFSSDSSWLASGSEDKSVRILNTETRSTFVLNDHTVGIHSVAWSPEDSQIATPPKNPRIATSSGDQVRIWNTTTGKLDLALKGNPKSTSSVAFSPDGQFLVAGSKDDIYLWDLMSGVDATILKGHTNMISSVSFSQDGQWILSSSWDKSVRLWERQSGMPICKWSGHTAIVHKAIFLDDRTVASCAQDRSVRFWDLSNEQVRKKDMTDGLELERHSGGVTTVAYSPNGERILTGSLDKSVREWDAETGIPKILARHSETIHAAVYSPGSDRLAVSGGNGQMFLCDKIPGQENLTLTGPSRMGQFVVFSANGRWIASGSTEGQIRLWDLREKDKEYILEGHSGPILSLAFSRDSCQLATCSEDNTIRLWNTGGDNPEPKLDEVLNHAATSVAYSPSDDTLAWGAKDRTICLWDVKLQEIQSVMKLEKLWDSVFSLAWSPCGNWFSTISRDFTLRLWRRKGEDAVWTQVFKEIVSDLTSLAWSPKESKLEFVTGSQDHSVCVWKVLSESGQARVQLVWGSSLNRLSSAGANITNAIGLDDDTRKLLRQHLADDKAAGRDANVQSLLNTFLKK